MSQAAGDPNRWAGHFGGTQKRRRHVAFPNSIVVQFRIRRRPDRNPNLAYWQP
jgi:hypothetical protein